jgi:hypothetical protein
MPNDETPPGVTASPGTSAAIASMLPLKLGRQRVHDAIDLFVHAVGPRESAFAAERAGRTRTPRLNTDRGDRLNRQRKLCVHHGAHVWRRDRDALPKGPGERADIQ